MKQVLSLEAFRIWCESKPADEEYAFTNSSICACAQYSQHLGMAPLAWRSAAYNGSFWKAADHAASYCSTFGELAARLRSIQL